MPRYYKQTANSQTYWAGDIFVLKDDGNLYWLGNENKEQFELESKKHWAKDHIAFNKRTLENFNILDNWYKEIDVDDIDNTNHLLPYNGCPIWCIHKEHGKFVIKKLIWNYGTSLVGTIVYTEERAKQIARIIELVDCGFEITDFELQKNIGKIVISGRYYAEASEKIEAVLAEGMAND